MAKIDSSVYRRKSLSKKNKKKTKPMPVQAIRPWRRDYDPSPHGAASSEETPQARYKKAQECMIEELYDAHLEGDLIDIGKLVQIHGLRGSHILTNVHEDVLSYGLARLDVETMVIDIPANEEEWLKATGDYRDYDPQFKYVLFENGAFLIGRSPLVHADMAKLIPFVPVSAGFIRLSDDDAYGKVYGESISMGLKKSEHRLEEVTIAQHIGRHANVA